MDTTKTAYEYICPVCGCWWMSEIYYDNGEEWICPDCDCDDSIEYYEDYDVQELL